MVGYDPLTNRSDSQWPWPRSRWLQRSKGQNHFANYSFQNCRRTSWQKI